MNAINISKLLKNVFGAFQRFIVIITPLLIVVAVARLYEVFLLQPAYGLANSLKINIIGGIYDIWFIARLSVPVFVVFAVVDWFSPKISKLIFRIIATAIVLISCILVTYYSIAGIPLDRSLFAYSLKEVFGIIGSSQKAAWWSYIFIIGIPAFYYLVSKRDYQIKNWMYGIYPLIVFAGFCFGKPMMDNSKDQYTADNKLRHFVSSVASGFNQKSSNPIAEDAALFQSHFPEHQFISTDFPFLHNDNSQNTLSDFFNLKDEKPNLVFVVVEGLGREFSGKNSTVPSATPFLDSLAANSLSWTNCLSTSMRTIQALPSIFGALPMGKTGFMNLRDNAPDYHSLLKILHQNGYRSSFFYGGWLCFDDMCYFMRQNQIDFTLDEHLYDSVPERNNWGIYDDFMFAEALKSIKNDNKPRIDVYLTLTTHDPFEYPDEEKYINQYLSIANAANTSVNSSMTRAYASYLFLDKSLRQLIDGYRQKPGFDNTIFVITGDHSFNTSAEPIEVHHVPLIIWSPMLKCARQMDALASHRDITPSFLALLKERYGISTPDKVAWLNRGLDTARQFRCTTFSPLLDVSRTISRMVAHGCLTDDNSTKQIGFNGKHMTLTNVADSLNTGSLLKSYRALDQYVTSNNALLESKSRPNGIYTVFSIESHGEQMFFFNKSGLEIGPYEGRNNTADISREFPMDICKYIVTGKENQIIVTTQFKIFLPKTDKSLKIVTSITRNGEQIHWSAEEINNANWFSGYNKWTDFATTYNMRADGYHYQKDDVIQIYIWNSSNCEAHLADLNISMKYTIK
ncbi:MAG: LTA synthase family protein [Salinivirgaceae bacterium]|nr:LTA synthase family protein [Salinivirgaceae bacterium]